MKRYYNYIIFLLSVGAISCTSLSEGLEEDLTVAPDANRRVRYEANPDASLREQMNNQSSEINRKRNVESLHQNDPATTPPSLRPQLVPNAPVDSATHRVQWPILYNVRPIGQ